ncbi:hypothetical protein F511_07122 [Dorcoceras hygrometricum]|nr:hypothetical protein F511_07122 [Dorcoceras hygrometricum]
MAGNADGTGSVERCWEGWNAAARDGKHVGGEENISVDILRDPRDPLVKYGKTYRPRILQTRKDVSRWDYLARRVGVLGRYPRAEHESSGWFSTPSCVVHGQYPELSDECPLPVLDLSDVVRVRGALPGPRVPREHCDVLSMQMDSDLVIYRTTLVRTFQVVTIYRVDKFEVLVVLISPHYSKRECMGKADMLAAWDEAVGASSGATVPPSKVAKKRKAYTPPEKEARHQKKKKGASTSEARGASTTEERRATTPPILTTKERPDPTSVFDIPEEGPGRATEDDAEAEEEEEGEVSGDESTPPSPPK